MTRRKPNLVPSAVAADVNTHEFHEEDDVGTFDIVDLPDSKDEEIHDL